MRRHTLLSRHLVAALALAALTFAAAGQTARAREPAQSGPMIPRNLPPDLGTSDTDDTTVGPAVPGGMYFPKTFVEVQLFSGDFEAWSKAITITQQQALTFRWWTFEADAVCAFWQLGDAPFTNNADPGNDPAMVTAGIVPAASQVGHWTYFHVTIPGGTFTPGQTYYLRMIPVGQGLTLAGPPSSAVVIHLAAPQPPTQFEEDMGVPGGMQRSAQQQPLRPGIQIQFPILRVRQRRHPHLQQQDQPQRVAPATPEQNETPPALRLRGLRLLGG